VNASTTARALARRELTLAITTAARRQIALHGPDALSVRAVARELGMASSAVYRYFPSRDELLTALIVEAYTALGDAVDRAIAAQPGVAEKIRGGKLTAAGALVGSVMKDMRGQVDAAKVKQLILARLAPADDNG